MCSVLFQMLLFDSILNFDVFFFLIKRNIGFSLRFFPGTELLSQSVPSFIFYFILFLPSFKCSLDLASYFYKFQSSSVASEILEIPLCSLF